MNCLPVDDLCHIKHDLQVLTAEQSWTNPIKAVFKTQDGREAHLFTKNGKFYLFILGKDKKSWETSFFHPQSP